MEVKQLEKVSVVDDLTSTVYLLQHIETKEFICLKHRPPFSNDPLEFACVFHDRQVAWDWREELKLVEHVDIVEYTLQDVPFDLFWDEGQLIMTRAYADRHDLGTY